MESYKALDLEGMPKAAELQKINSRLGTVNSTVDQPSMYDLYSPVIPDASTTIVQKNSN